MVPSVLFSGRLVDGPGIGSTGICYMFLNMCYFNRLSPKNFVERHCQKYVSCKSGIFYFILCVSFELMAFSFCDRWLYVAIIYTHMHIQIDIY